MKKISNFRLRKVASKGDSTFGKILGSAFIASTSTAGAYVVGLFFHNRHLSTLRFNAELYPKSSSDYFFYAYVAFTELVSGIFLTEGIVTAVLILVFFLAWLVLLAIAANAVSDSHWMTRQKERVAASKKSRQVGLVVFLPILGTALIVYIPFLLLIMLIAPWTVGESMGEKRGLLDKQHFLLPCETPKAGLFCTEITSSDGARVALGYVVDASDKYIAVVEMGRARSIPVDGHSYSAYPTTLKAK